MTDDKDEAIARLEREVRLLQEENTKLAARLARLSRAFDKKVRNG